MVPRLFPGLLYAITAGIPGIWIAIWFSSPRIREKSLTEFVELCIKAIPVLLPLYAIPTLAYGSLVWLVLRAMGQLNLIAMVLAGVLPVLVYWIWSVVMYGWEPRALWALGTFSIPAVVISVSLWWFTTWGAR
jgi:hypothetical protein